LRQTASARQPPAATREPAPSFSWYLPAVLRVLFLFFLCQRPHANKPFVSPWCFSVVLRVCISLLCRGLRFAAFFLFFPPVLWVSLFSSLPSYFPLQPSAHTFSKVRLNHYSKINRYRVLSLQLGLPHVLKSQTKPLR